MKNAILEKIESVKQAAQALGFILVAGAVQPALADVTCFYQVAEDGLVGTATLNIEQNHQGRAVGGSFEYRWNDGHVATINLPAQSIKLHVKKDPGAAELALNVRVKSDEANFLLNYLGDDFAHDAAEWTGTFVIGSEELLETFTQIKANGNLDHNIANPIVQLSGSLQFEDGLAAVSSSKFVCASH